MFCYLLQWDILIVNILFYFNPLALAVAKMYLEIEKQWGVCSLPSLYKLTKNAVFIPLPHFQEGTLFSLPPT